MEKTEEPTPRRLREARRRGEAARSADLTAGLSLAGTALALGAFGPGMVDGLVEGVRGAAALAARSDLIVGPSEALGLVTGQAFRAGVAMTPVLLTTLGLGAGVTALQVGGLFAPGAVLPKGERIDPFKGTRRLFSRARLVDIGKALIKGTLLAGVAVGVAYAGVRGLPGLAASDAPRIARSAAELGEAVLFRGGVALALFGALDLAHQRWRFRRERRMSKDEVRREHKDQEGDPSARAERQRAHREIVEHGILEDVRRADVVVVNPTHLAVALRYAPESEQDAPELLAKGRDDLARRIVAVAREAGVPVLRDVGLAHSLTALELGESIPERLFDAVAAVLLAAWDERDGRGTDLGRGAAVEPETVSRPRVGRGDDPHSSGDDEEPTPG